MFLFLCSLLEHGFKFAFELRTHSVLAFSAKHRMLFSLWGCLVLLKTCTSSIRMQKSPDHFVFFGLFPKTLD
jgi:hypothetical protein